MSPLAPRVGQGVSLGSRRRTAAYSPLWGANPTSDAMTLAAAAVSLVERTLFPTHDEEDSPIGVNVAAPGPFTAAALHCCTMDARQNGMLITIRRN